MATPKATGGPARLLLPTALLIAAACGGSGGGEPAAVRVAVAANFAATHELLAEAFRAETGHPVQTSAGSTGKLYAQVRGGAPYDVFLSADARAPRLLEEEGLAIAGTRFAYAVGRLVLYAGDGRELSGGAAVLREGAFERLALANPELAPYGAAARQVLERLGLWDALADRVVRGESVAQALHFVESGGVELGLVALAQVRGLAGSRWEVLAELHDPIRQEAVLLEPGRERPAARAYLEFLRGPAARERIAAAGYGLED